MKMASRMAFGKASAFAITMLLGWLMAGSQMFAQTPVVPKKPTLPLTKPAVAPVKSTAVPAKPVAAAATPAAATKAATPVPVAKTATAPVAAANTTTTSTGGTTTIPSTLVPSTSTASTGASSTALNSFPTSSSAASSTPSSGDPRAPVVGQGIGTFLWPGGWTLTAYGCFRTGTRLFCDFDTTNQGNVYANSSAWAGGGGVNVVDDGGKITGRHDAFFVGTDGSQFPNAYITPQPVRFVIEYDDIDQRFTSVSLVLGRDRIQGVPITLIDPSQPAGKIPARVLSGAPAQGTQTAAAPGAAGASNGLDKATQGVNTINDQKKKAQSLWQSVQSVAQPH